MDDGKFITKLLRLVGVPQKSRRRGQAGLFSAIEGLESRVVLSAVTVQLSYIEDVPDVEVSGAVFGPGGADATVQFDFEGLGGVSDSANADDFGRFAINYPQNLSSGDTIWFRITADSYVGNWQSYVLSEADSVVGSEEVFFAEDAVSSGATSTLALNSSSVTSSQTTAPTIGIGQWGLGSAMPTEKPSADAEVEGGDPSGADESNAMSSGSSSPDDATLMSLSSYLMGSF